MVVVVVVAVKKEKVVVGKGAREWERKLINSPLGCHLLPNYLLTLGSISGGGISSGGSTYLRHVTQLPEPAVPESVLGIGATDVVPDAGQPMSHYGVEADEQDEHHGSVLNVPIHLANHSAQTQQAHHFEGAEKGADSLLLLGEISR